MNTESLESSKKRRETRAVETLRSLDAAFPAGSLYPGRAGEEPDFVVDAGDQRVGIEVVEYFTPPHDHRWSPKERDRLIERIVKEATARCRSLGINEVLATVEFDDTTAIGRVDIESVASEIAALAGRVTAHHRSLYLRNRAGLPAPVKSICAYHREGVPDSFIGLGWGGVVGRANEDALTRLIRSKEVKLSIYRRRCPVVWLLVLVDQYQAASMAYVPNDYRLEQSFFDRVVVLQGWTEAINLWPTAA